MACLKMISSATCLHLLCRTCHRLFQLVATCRPGPIRSLHRRACHTLHSVSSEKYSGFAYPQYHVQYKQTFHAHSTDTVQSGHILLVTLPHVTVTLPWPRAHLSDHAYCGCRTQNYFDNGRLWSLVVYMFNRKSLCRTRKLSLCGCMLAPVIFFGELCTR